MNQTRKISILVSGNPQSNAGWSDIAMFNNANYRLEDNTYPGFSHLPKFYVVRIENSSVKGLHGNMIDTSKVIYTLVMNNVRSAAASRDGRLKISFSIPKGYRLAGNVTPKQVMDDLEKSFTEKCMTLVESDNRTLEFNPGIIDSDVLDDVGYKYLLEAYEGPFRPMNPLGPVGYIETGDTEHLEAAMADMQYEELSGFKEVILAESSFNCSFQKVDVEIPRRPVFSLVGMIYDRFGRVKVEKTSKTLKDPNMELSIPAPISPEPYYKYEPVRFTLNELDKMPSSNVTVDRAAETITVSFHPVPIKKEYGFEIKMADNVTSEYLKSHKTDVYKISDNAKLPINIKDCKFELIGIDNKYFENNQIDVNIPVERGYEIDKKVSCDPLSSKVILDVKVTPPSKPEPPVALINAGERVNPHAPVGGSLSLDPDLLIPLTVIVENPNLIATGGFITIKIQEYDTVMFRALLRKELGRFWQPGPQGHRPTGGAKARDLRHNPMNMGGKRKGKNLHPEARNARKQLLDSPQEEIGTGGLRWMVGIPSELAVAGRNRKLVVSTKDWSFRADEFSKQNNYTVIVPADAEESSNFAKKSKAKRWLKKFWSLGVMVLLVAAVIVLASLGKFSGNSVVADNAANDTVPQEEIVDPPSEESTYAMAQDSYYSGIEVNNIDDFSHIIEAMISGHYGDRIPLDSIGALINSPLLDKIKGKNPSIEEVSGKWRSIVESMTMLDVQTFARYLKDNRSSLGINLTDEQIKGLEEMKKEMEERNPHPRQQYNKPWQR